MDRAGLSDTLCRHIAEAPASAVPQSAMDAAAVALMDAVGVMLAASGQSADVGPFIDLAKSQGRGPCAILGVGATTSAPLAAFANGAMAHALDFEDAFDLAPSHPNASLMPAAIAMAQAGPPVDGPTFLSALAIGCDLVCRLGLSLERPMEDGGWYPPPMLGAFGAAAAASRIAGLSADETRNALSLILCQVTAPGEIKHSAGTNVRAVREAFPAQAAVTAVQLAKAGVVGFETPFEGKGGFFRLYVQGDYSEGGLLEALGETWYGEQLSFKPWPACRGTHAFIEIALDLLARENLDWRDVLAIEVETGEVQTMLVEPLARKQAPQNAIDAKFSIPFTLATALVRGGVGLDDFTTEALGDPETLALAARINPVRRQDWGRDMASAGALRITMNDGRTFEGERHTALGHPIRPMSDAALLEKFVSCAARAARPLQTSAARTLGEQLLNLGQASDAGRALLL